MLKRTTLAPWIIVAPLLTCACAGPADRTPSESTARTSSALNADPGTPTSLSFHSAGGLDVEMRSVTPPSQGDPMFIRYQGLPGEASDAGRHEPQVAVFSGDVTGGTPDQVAAALVPLHAAVLGQLSLAQVSSLTGLTIRPTSFQPVAVSVDSADAYYIALQAVTFAALHAGPVAAQQAQSYLELLYPCGPTGSGCVPITTGQ